MTVLETAARTYRSALPGLLVSAAGGLVAGAVLGDMQSQLQSVPGLLVVVPAFLAIRGSVYGSLGARLASGLHQGLVEPFETDERVRAAVAAALLTGLTASGFAALAVYTVLSVLGRPVAGAGTLLVIALVGGLLAGVALTAVLLVVVFGGYTRGLNPDDLVGPATTTAGDVFGMLALLAATELALAL